MLICFEVLELIPDALLRQKSKNQALYAGRQQGNSLGFAVLEKKSCGFSVPLFLYLSDVIRFR